MTVLARSESGAQMDVMEQVSELISTNFGASRQEITPEATLRSVGVDSMALEELRVMLEKSLQIDLDEVELTPDHSIQSLLSTVRSVAAA
ncbi:acyl carrier protein [Streptomyces sp. NPDC058000]|uniref:acyl carrier protein n=1 Tax=Streptomyces sp. NPDC058000 TaxID=3346299 RepID=UPI0036EA0837